MTMTYKFSASKNAFYLFEEKSAYIENDLWGDDVVDVSDEIWGEFCGQPPKGKVRGADGEGMPCWTDAPKMTPEEQCAMDCIKKDEMLAIAEQQIFRLSVLKVMNNLTVKELDRLKEWQEHFVKIYRAEPGQGKVMAWPEPPAME